MIKVCSRLDVCEAFQWRPEARPEEIPGWLLASIGANPAMIQPDKSLKGMIALVEFHARPGDWIVYQQFEPWRVYSDEVFKGWFVPVTE